MSIRNSSWGGEGSRCVGLTTLPLSCADYLEIWEASTSWNPQGLSRPVMGLPYLYLHIYGTKMLISAFKSKRMGCLRPLLIWIHYLKTHSFNLLLKEKISKHQIQSATDFLPPGIFSAFTIFSSFSRFDCPGICVYVCGIGISSEFSLINKQHKFTVILFGVAVFNRFINDYLHNPKTWHWL